MTGGQWAVLLVAGGSAVIIITALLVAALRDDKDWEHWGWEDNDR